MKKRILKVTGVFILVFLLVIIAVPFLLKGKIGEVVKNKVNNSVNAEFNFVDVDLSLFSNFPKATLKMRETTVINNAPFLGDTLFSAEALELSLSVGELFKDASEPINISSLYIENALVNIKVDESENANYDIAIESDSDVVDDGKSNSAGFVLSLQSYQINNSRFNYANETSKIELNITDFQHSGSGDLSAEVTQLNTKTTSKVTYASEGKKYLTNVGVKLDALLNLDLENSKYSFLENKAFVNNLELIFDGFIKLNDENQEIDITFKTPSTNFSNFVDLVPNEYTKDISSVKTSGNFEVSGNVNGIIDETHIPKFAIHINSENASVNYPDLPKTVKNIFINTHVSNTSGIVEDTFIDIKKLSFSIDEDVFFLNSQISNVSGNPKVKVKVNADMDLSKISQAYPVPENYDLKGFLIADLAANFDMASLDKKEYQKTKAEGQFSLKNFEYKSSDINNPILIHKTAVRFDKENVFLDELDGATGDSDFKAKGKLTNFLGFVFNDENVQGDFILKANSIKVSDFMTSAENESNSEDNSVDEGETIKIPAFLDCTINASANTVVYDNLNLKNVSATMVVKDQKAILSNVKSSLFGGDLSFGGTVSTKEKTPSFDMNLKMNGFNLGDTFAEMEMFKAIAPLAKSLSGSLNSTIVLKGILNDDLTPNLSKISGDVIGQILGVKVNSEKSNLLNSLDGQLGFVNLEELNVKDLKTNFSFNNGKVTLKPVTFNYKDIPLTLSGNHAIDSEMDYKLTLDVPAKYLGKEVNNLLQQIGDKESSDVTVPVNALFSGNIKSPNMSTDLKSATTSLTNKLVAIQKQKLLNKGKNKLSDLLGETLGGDKKEGDSANTKTTEGVINDVLSTIGKKKDDTVKHDSSKQDNVTKAVEVLGGLLGVKKKKKDSVN